MQRKPVCINLGDFPDIFHSFLQDAAIFDSSCSRIAKVWFIDKEAGFYLKRAPKNTLKKAVFFSKSEKNQAKTKKM